MINVPCRRIGAMAAAVALSSAMLSSGVLVSAAAWADPDAPAGHDFGPGPHNVTYRARVDGVARGVTVSYVIADGRVNTATPSMLPGEVLETTGVVSTPATAGMQVSIQWPYSASLHCEILIDEQVTAQADQVVAARIAPPRDDPEYGVLSCGNVNGFPTGNTAPVDGSTLAIPAA